MATFYLCALLGAGSLLLLGWLAMRRPARIYCFLRDAFYAAGIHRPIPSVCYTILTSRTINALGADRSRASEVRRVERVVEIVVAWVRDGRTDDDEAGFRYVTDCLKQAGVPLRGISSGNPRTAPGDPTTEAPMWVGIVAFILLTVIPAWFLFPFSDDEIDYGYNFVPAMFILAFWGLVPIGYLRQRFSKVRARGADSH